MAIVNTEDQLDLFVDSNVMVLINSLKKELRDTSRSLHAKIRDQKIEIEVLTASLEDLIHRSVYE